MILQYVKEFGVGMYIFNGMTRIMKKLRVSQRLIDNYTEWKHRVANAYLYKRYQYTLSVDLVKMESEENVKNCVFVFWWQGYEQAPELVKKCIDSMKQNSGLDVVYLSSKNYMEYVTLPDYIIDKMQRGKIGLAHFSDILRFALLYHRGGVWIDATCLLTNAIPQDVFKYDFYSLNGPFSGIKGLDWKWTSFYMVGKRGNIVSKYMLEFYYQYWKEHDCSLTYLILDCWLSVLYSQCPEVRICIDAMPKVDKSVFGLVGQMNSVYDKYNFKNIMEKTYLHKLTYKVQYAKNIGNEMTIWGYICENLNACELEN